MLNLELADTDQLAALLEAVGRARDGFDCPYCNRPIVGISRPQRLDELTDSLIREIRARQQDEPPATWEPPDSALEAEIDRDQPPQAPSPDEVDDRRTLE